jgi:DNA topoisomerase-1
MGRFGPFVQIGTRDDEEKPRFASLRPDQRIDTIELDQALELFKLPRELGTTSEDEPVSSNIGRFGPYIRYGGKFVSLKGDDDPYTVTLERALELVHEHKTAEANKIIQAFTDSPIQILRGRYGPYITDGKKNARIPKDREPESLNQAECEQLLAQAAEKKPRRRPTRNKKSTA